MATLAAAPTLSARPNEQALAYVGLSVAALGWASGFISGKFALAEMQPLAVGAWRYAAAAIVLLPFALRQRPRVGLGTAMWPLAFMVAVGGVAYPWLFLAALARTSATNTALLIALNPVITTLLAPLVGERRGARALGGVLLALAGAVLVITRGDLAVLAALSHAKGDVFALAAAVAWAGFNLAARGVAGRLTPAFTNFVIYAIGGLVLGLLGRAEAPVAQLAAASLSALGGLLALAILSSVIAGQLFLTGVHVVGVSRTVVFIHLVPVLTAALATTVLGEPFTLAQAVGGAAVLAGVYWTTRGGAR